MFRPLRSLLGFAFLCAWIFSAGCNSASNQPTTNPKPPESSAAASLRPGDTLVVAIQGVPDPTSNNVQIDEKGFITLPYIGNIEAARSTTATLSEKIRQTYLAKKIYNALDVSVTVTERYVYVGGEVVRPGRVIWTPDLTVAKAIQAAGGFTLYAKEGRVSLVRDRNAYTISVPLAQRNPAEDPRLIPGDAIQVPKSAF
jgi:polysaccharide export outer membrane protein